MTHIKDKVDAECYYIEKQLALLPSPDRLPYEDQVYVAGVGALLNSICNGIENVLKQVLADKDIVVPSGPRWHRDLVDKARELGIVSEPVFDLVIELISFRHFFVHAYSSEIYTERVGVAVEFGI